MLSCLSFVCCCIVLYIHISFARHCLQEDTLACILALDGFYHDGRNIRASYGTSKYCSAFIKSVKCNNPDCTYLHHMGDQEDTFTKQEIQAGYVTSGRDVLARQQQIMAQQAAAAFGNSTGTGRKKVGGGGPSGTGKASSNPVFPPPSFDEPLPKNISRQQAAAQRMRNLAANPAAVAALAPGAGAPSAASIVAGSRNAASNAAPAPHTTLTPLTPLKRAGSGSVSAKSGVAGAPKPVGIVGGTSDLTPAESMALEDQKRETLAQQQREMAQKMSKQSESAKGPQSPEISGVKENGSAKVNSGIIGGPPIGSIGSPGIGGSTLNMGAPLLGGGFSSNLGGVGYVGSSSLEFGSIGHATGSGILGGQPIESKSGLIGGVSLASSNNFSLDSFLSGSGNQSNFGQSNLFGGGDSLWSGEDPASARRSTPAPIGPSNGGINVGSDIGGTSLFGTNQSLFSNGGGSSALASLLGVQLPTGSGSLRDSSSSTIFPGGSVAHAPVGGNVIGSIGTKSGGGILPIGSSQGGLTVGGFANGAANGGNSNDVALLQSLLPGVNITSGNAYRPAAPQQPVGVGGLNQGSDHWNGGGSAQQNERPTHEQQRSGNIW